MRHKYFRFLACVAMVMACVMFFEVPVSAVSYIDLSDYFLSSTSQSGNIIKKYFYPIDSSKSSISHGWYYGTDMKSGQNRHIGFHDEVTLTKDYNYYTFRFSPIYNHYNATGASYSDSYDENIDVRDVLSSDLTSHSVSMQFSLHSTVPVSGWIRLYGSISGVQDGASSVLDINGTKVPFTMTEEYMYVNVEDILSDLSSDYQYIKKLEYVIRFDNVPSGTTIGFSTMSPGDELLDSGVLFTTKQIKPQEAPRFTTNLSTQTLSYLVGAAASPLTVNASVSDGGVITYQWYKAVSESAAGSVISGATSRSYVPDTTVESDAYYYCVATSTLDGKTLSKTSNVAHVVVVKKPEKPQVVSDLNNGAVIEYYQDRTPGDLVFGVLSPDGGTLTYQWYRNSRSSTDGGTEITGAKGPTYKPSTAALGTSYYYCVATNSKSIYSESVTSGVVGIRVVAPPDPAKAPTITADLAAGPFTYTEGDAASPLRIGAASPDGGELSYQWYELVDGSGKALAGEVYPSFTPPTGVPGEYQYYCVVTNTFFDTTASATSSVATVVVEEDQTDSLLGSIIGGISDLIDGILNLPTLIIDGIKGLFIPDTQAMAAYQNKWLGLLSSRFGAIYEAVVLIDEFGQAISEQTKQGIITFPEVTVDLAGTPWTFGGWDVKVVPDGFDAVIVTLKSAVNIVCTFAFVNGLRHRFEGAMGGA